MPEQANTAETTPRRTRWYKVLVWPGLNKGEKPRAYTLEAASAGAALDKALSKASVVEREKHAYTVARIPAPTKPDEPTERTDQASSE